MTTGIGILPMTVLMAAMGNSINILPLWAWVLVLVILGAAVYGFSRPEKNPKINKKQ